MKYAVVALACVFVAALAQQAQEPPLPPFLQGAPADKVAEFEQLLATSHTLTDAQIDSAVDSWIGKQSPEIQGKYASFKEELKKHQSNAETAHKAAIDKFSPEAKDADEKLSTIANDAKLTAQEKGQKIEQLLNGLPENVRQEIETAMQG